MPTVISITALCLSAPSLWLLKLNSRQTRLELVSEWACLVLRTGSITDTLSIHYEEIKYILKRALTTVLEKRWRSHALIQPEWIKRHYRCKAHWGIDMAIASLPNEMASAYILFRLNYRLPLLTLPRKTCKLCDTLDPGISHFLWQCTATAVMRIKLNGIIRQTITPAMCEQLSLLDEEALTDFVLGTGAHSLPNDDWKCIVRSTAEFAMNTYSQAAAM